MLDSIPISIEIEIGRRHKIIKTDRICTFCFNQGENVIEDEFHFIMECNLYVDLLRKYRRENTVQKNMNSFIQLMSCKNIHNFLAFTDMSTIFLELKGIYKCNVPVKFHTNIIYIFEPG